MKAYLWSNGCLSNHLDELAINKFLIKNDWEIIDNIRDADLIIFNTCAFSGEKEDFAIENISNSLKIKKDGAEVIVGGCLPLINKERLESIFQGSTFNPHNIKTLDSKVKGIKKGFRDLTATELCNTKFDTRIKYKFDTKIKYIKKRNLRKLFSRLSITNILAYFIIYTTGKRIILREYFNKTFPIRVSTGCLSNCSYCAIKKAKGSLKSRHENEIIKDFGTALEKGLNKFVLDGEDVGAYGQDLKSHENIVTLLRKLVKFEGNFKIAIRYFNPQWLIKYHKYLLEIFDTNKISSITVPIQSGSEKILKLMKRGYDVKKLEKLLLDIKKRFPKIKIYTHFIFGFPGEDEEDFRKTLDLINLVRFDFTNVLRFESRPGTLAEEMSNQVPENIKNKRVRRACLNLFLIELKKRLFLE